MWNMEPGCGIWRIWSLSVEYGANMDPGIGVWSPEFQTAHASYSVLDYGLEYGHNSGLIICTTSKPDLVMLGSVRNS